MVSTTMSIAQENSLKNEKKFSNDHVHQIVDSMLPQFTQILKSYVIFNMLFLGAGIVELTLLLFLFTFWVHSSLLAFTLALIFLTMFSYFISRLYFQTKKPDQFIDLRNRYVDASRKLANGKEGTAEYHLNIAKACYLFAAALQGKEYRLYSPPKWMIQLAPLFEKFSGWWHWHDFHKMKEMLLQASVNEHIELVKCEPTNLEAHAALANAYVMLSGLYVDLKKIEGEDDERRPLPKQFTEVLQQKFRMTAERAIEEFKILNDYAPNDPWVHAQLAYSYHDLQMPKEEIKEYEIILKLRPDDREILFKLGTLYFQQGLNAQGLKIYEELKRTHFKKAEQLIKFYGAYDLHS